MNEGITNIKFKIEVASMEQGKRCTGQGTCRRLIVFVMMYFFIFIFFFGSTEV
jgi:hypothetical protein